MKNSPLAHSSTEVCALRLLRYAPVGSVEARPSRASEGNVCTSLESALAAPSSRTESTPENAHSLRYYTRLRLPTTSSVTTLLPPSKHPSSTFSHYTQKNKLKTFFR